MVKVIAPLFSLSASGVIGKCLLYYGVGGYPRVRRVRSRFTSPGNIWEVNKEWFKKASARAKTLTEWQKKAWPIAYPSKCDTWRDIFMGKQIEMWNASPLNDISWPPCGVGKVGDIYVDLDEEYDLVVFVSVALESYTVFDRYCVGWVWFNVLDSPNAPTEDDLSVETGIQNPSVNLEAGHTNYIWGGVRYVNGSWDVVFLDSYDR